MANRYISCTTIWKLISSFILTKVCTATQQCSMVDVKSLLEGCDRLVGLNITSVGGTMVNDHNCDVLLPKQVFIEEPLYQYGFADSVCITELIFIVYFMYIIMYTYYVKFFDT